jgi:predicted amidohydrolase YtcJ
VLDRDPIACRIDEIAETKVLRTVHAGETVYDSGALLPTGS